MFEAKNYTSLLTQYEHFNCNKFDLVPVHIHFNYTFCFALFT